MVSARRSFGTGLNALVAEYKQIIQNRTGIVGFFLDGSGDIGLNRSGGAIRGYLSIGVDFFKLVISIKNRCPNQCTCQGGTEPETFAENALCPIARTASAAAPFDRGNQSGYAEGAEQVGNLNQRQVLILAVGQEIQLKPVNRND